MTLEFETVTRLASLDALRDEWQSLYERTDRASIFLDFDWVRMCFARREAGAQHPLVALVRENGILVLALPLQRVRHLLLLRRYHGLQTLLPQYTDGLVARDGDPAAWTRALLRGLRRDFRAQALGLDRLPERSLLNQSSLDRRLSGRVRGTAPAAEMANGFEAYFAGFARGSRSQIRRMERQMEERGGVRLRLSTPETVDADLDWLLTRKREWTPQQGALRPWLTSREAEEDLRRLARVWTGNGKMWLAQLEVGGARAAASLSLVSAGVEAVCYVITHDQRFAATSPGRILMVRMIEHAAARQVPAYDFMMAETAWKTRLKTADRPIVRVRLRLG